MTETEFEEQVEKLVDMDPDKATNPENCKFDCGEDMCREYIGAMMSDVELMKKHKNHILPYYFPNEAHALSYRCLTRLFGEHAAMPTKPQLMHAIRQELKDRPDETRLSYLAEFSTCWEYYRNNPAPQAIDWQLTRFADQAALHVGMYKILDAAKKGMTFEETDFLVQELLLDKRRKIRATKHKAQWIDLLQFRDRAEAQRPDYIVEGWLQENRLHLLAGREKSGKSTLIWCLVVSLLTGRDWLGMPCKQSPVIYLDYENGDDYVWDSLLSNLEAAGVNPESVANLWRTPGPAEPDTSVLLPTALTAEWLRSTLPESGLNAPVIVIDAAGPAFAGLFTDTPNWDNSRSEVHKALAPLRQLCHEGLCTVVVIHHNNKDGVFMGSVAWRSEVDHCWAFSRPEESNEAKLTHIGRTLSRTDALSIVKEGQKLVCTGKVNDQKAAAKRLDEMKDDSTVLACIPFGSRETKSTTIEGILVALGKDWSKKTIRDPLERLVTAGRVQRHRDTVTSPYLYWRNGLE